MSDVLQNLSFISHYLAKSKIFFPPSFKKFDPANNFSQVEIDYLISVFKEYHFIASYKNGFLELKVNTNASAFTPKFDPSHFTCNLTKISLNCLETLPNTSFMIIWQVLQNIQGLKDITLHLQKVNNSDLIILFNLIFNLKTLERLNVQMDLTDISKNDVCVFMQNLANIKNLLSLEIQRKAPHTTISFQLVQVFTPVPPLTTLQEISLNLDCIPEVCGTLHTLNSNQAKSLRVFKLSFGKTACNPQVLGAVCETLNLQSEIEELNFMCEELSESSSSDLSKFLTASTKKKKLRIFVNKALVREHPTKFLPKSHDTLQNLEEFTLKIKYDSCITIAENFQGLVDFLSSMKALKKLCLHLDGVDSGFTVNHKLFSQIGKLQTLVLLEVEYISPYGLANSDKRAFENLLNKLPNSVTKKCVFKRSEYRSYYDDDGWGDDSDYSGYSDEDVEYLQDNDDEEF